MGNEDPVALGIAAHGFGQTIDGGDGACRFHFLAVEELGHVIVLVPARRLLQRVAVLGLKLGGILGVVDQVLAVVEHVGVTVVGHGVTGVAPGGDAVGIERDDVLQFELVEDLLRDRLQIAGGHEVAGPVRGEDQHVIVDRPGLEGGDHFLEQFAEGKLL